MRFSALYIPILFFLLNSCVKDATNIDLPDTSGKLVVTCFISPDDTLLQANLSWSTPINQYPNNQKTLDLQYASVVLSDDDSQVSLTFVDTSVYRSFDENYFVASTRNFQIIPGKMYQLKVTANSGEIVTATTVVPVKLDTSLSYKFYASDENIQGEILTDIEFTDIPSESNYYRVGIRVENKPGCFGNPNFYFEDQSEFVSDAGRDGLIIRFRKGHVFSYCQSGQNDSISLYLANVDYNYFKFHQTLENFTGDDPFSEPAQLYTNVQGGLGAFGSYRLFVKKVPFKI